MQNKFIEAINVTYGYDLESEQQVAVNNINLSVEKGSFTVILGHNGSGKSTLAKLLNGMLKPDFGKILVDGLDTSDENNEYDIRRKLGLVFQNPDNQIICTIVEEDVAFGPENLGIEPKEIRKRVDEALESVGMSDFAKSAPHQLSGGQKQRIALAGILAMQPDCIVLDEPTAMLDPVGRKEVINTITRLNKEKNITVILITHFMEEAENADRVIIMNKGKIAADGKPEEIFALSDVLTASGLALPQTTELLTTLKNSGLDLNNGIISPKAAADELLSVIRGRL
ncbi:MAG: energy-coupling factor transporter ATPase [Clostridia bacterium]|nr:energy-coupling factor transporter ATPase [Clostridia bacterium]MBQ9919848.1 energy-coupling factor transporter ATPase [Clostridia bacterium]